MQSKLAWVNFISIRLSQIHHQYMGKGFKKDMQQWDNLGLHALLNISVKPRTFLDE